MVRLGLAASFHTAHRAPRTKLPRIVIENSLDRHTCRTPGYQHVVPLRSTHAHSPALRAPGYHHAPLRVFPAGGLAPDGAVSAELQPQRQHRPVEVAIALCVCGGGGAVSVLWVAGLASGE